MSAVTRIEVIDETGRVYVRWGVHVEVDMQDAGRTMKVFVLSDPEAAPRDPTQFIDCVDRAQSRLLKGSE